MAKISKETFSFLKDLEANNNREWFAENKPRYESAKEEFEQFIDELMLGIAEFDNSITHHAPKDCIFRIYRDVRFSKDKSPYKTHFGAHITAAQKRSDIHSKAGYYLHLAPGGTLLAGGAYMPNSDWLKKIRSSIDQDASQLREIINNPDFKKTFGSLGGEKLKTAPRDYPKDHPEIELLKHKSFVVSTNCSDSLVLSETFLNHCVQVFRTLYPFDQYLNNTIE
ncbi:DUF2461 domain-containing protein [Luteibaculum oceani]|uniref:DUF2461 domain-containing protein n=1 Tax=Luteibaculum oceani TaxID=1294296 RepID=A0A5C6V4Y7_9FLAO|nr:DUF2461 domain-containing protein [Luteibaculum oceani]TXC78625.1 DUF2461 domain-containing protein [Luteibaculum oceani]